MPEGPEIRRAADRISAVLTGRELEAVWFGLPRLVRFSDLRSEILFAARLHPARKPRDLTVKLCNQLARQTLLIARRAYETGGITNPQARVAALQAQGLTRRRYRFAVFGRAGAPCPVCGTSIERSEAVARRIYHCPTCQPRFRRTGA